MQRPFTNGRVNSWSTATLRKITYDILADVLWLIKGKMFKKLYEFEVAEFDEFIALDARAIA